MSNAIRAPFVLFARSLAALGVILAGACSQAPETIATADEAVKRPAANPPAAQPAAQAEAPEACDPGHREGCGCDPGKSAMAEADPGVREQVAIGRSPTRGPADAPVTIVIFADFECPFCARVQSTLHALEEDYPGKVRLVYKHWPLPFHTHADLAARAAIAAQAQGKFWEMHEALFKAQKDLTEPAIEAMASSLGLDLGRLRRDMRSSETDALLAADKAEVERLRIQGAPSFFVNGRRIQGAQPIEVFRKAIDQALQGG
jgi:protein-disulfide isomerase